MIEGDHLASLLSAAGCGIAAPANQHPSAVLLGLCWLVWKFLQRRRVATVPKFPRDKTLLWRPHKDGPLISFYHYSTMASVIRVVTLPSWNPSISLMTAPQSGRHRSHFHRSGAEVWSSNRFFAAAALSLEPGLAQHGILGGKYSRVSNAVRICINDSTSLRVCF